MALGTTERRHTRAGCSSGLSRHSFGAVTNSRFYVTRLTPPTPCVKKLIISQFQTEQNLGLSGTRRPGSAALSGHSVWARAGRGSGATDTSRLRVERQVGVQVGVCREQAMAGAVEVCAGLCCARVRVGA